MTSFIFFFVFFFVSGLQIAHFTPEKPRNYLECPAVDLDDDPYRTAFHFQPSRHWMNDPNGPMVYNGIYHLFYQYYPYGAVWNTKIVWGHSTSIDLVNWESQPIALSPSQPSDINGCWSGSITILSEHGPINLYTGITAEGHQVQNLAKPKNISDLYLREWVKSTQNPLMYPSPENKINATSFRDPSTAWVSPHDGQWRVIVGSQQWTQGLAILFKSEDFVHWIQANEPLHSAPDNGVWECLDFYPVYENSSQGADTSQFGLGIKHVLKVSLYDTQYEYYTIGTYDVEKDVYIPDEDSVEDDSGLRYDYGKFYASKSFYDNVKQRRILWGWVNESSTQADDIKKGWSGLQAIPRTVALHKSGKQLIQWPILEIETLRHGEVELPSQVIQGGSLLEVPNVTASQADVEVSFKIRDFKKVEEMGPNWANPQVLCTQKGASVQGGLGPFGLFTLASMGLEEYTAVFFRIFKAHDKFVVLLCSDQSRSSLNPTTDKLTYGTFMVVDPTKEELSLRTLIDRSIVESFGANGKSCITARTYPTLAIDEEAHLYVFNYGTNDVEMTALKAWSMKKASINNEDNAFNGRCNIEDQNDMFVVD